MVEISENFVAFSKYTNFISLAFECQKFKEEKEQYSIKRKTKIVNNDFG